MRKKGGEEGEGRERGRIRVRFREKGVRQKSGGIRAGVYVTAHWSSATAFTKFSHTFTEILSKNSNIDQIISNRMQFKL